MYDLIISGMLNLEIQWYIVASAHFLDDVSYITMAFGHRLKRSTKVII